MDRSARPSTFRLLLALVCITLIISILNSFYAGTLSEISTTIQLNAQDAWRRPVTRTAQSGALQSPRSVRSILPTHQDHPHLPYVVSRFSASAFAWEDLVGNKSRKDAARFFNAAMFRKNNFGALTDYQDAEVYIVQGGKLHEINASLGTHAQQCKLMVVDNFVYKQIKLESMYYHFLLENFDGLVTKAFWSGPPEDSARMHYVLLNEDPKEGLFGMFGLLSERCWRVLSKLPDGMCLAQNTVAGHDRYLTSTGDMHDYVTDVRPNERWMEEMLGPGRDLDDLRVVFDFIRHRMHLPLPRPAYRPAQPPLPSQTEPSQRHTKPSSEPSSNDGRMKAELEALLQSLQNVELTRLPPRVLIMQRNMKRFILNIEEVLDVSLAMGVDASILYIDELTLHELIEALSTTTILVAIHGAGLSNLGFLPMGASVLEISYPGSQALGVSVYFGARAYGLGLWHQLFEVTSKDLVPKWEYMPNVTTPAERTAFLEAGVDDWNDFYTFWLNCDIHVDLSIYRKVMQKLLAITPVHLPT